MEKQKQYINELSSLIPLLSVAFLVYSTVEIFFYFQFFNFNILPFLEITEFLPLTLFDFIITIIGIIIWLIISLLIKTYFSKRINYIFFSSIGMCFLTLIVFDSLKENYTQLVDRDLYLLTIVLSGTLILFFNNLVTILRSTYQYTIITSFVFLLVVGNAKYRAFNKFYDAMYCDHYLDTYIVIDKGNLIKSNYQHFYIGKCKSDFIFYNRKTRGVDLYPVSSVSHTYINSK